jgi:hypothetical protein
MCLFGQVPEIHTLKRNLLIAYFTKPLKHYGLAGDPCCLTEYPARYPAD